MKTTRLLREGSVQVDAKNYFVRCSLCYFGRMLRMCTVLWFLFFVACSSENIPKDAPPIDAPSLGTASISWEVTQDGSPTTCTALDASFVRVEFRPVAGGSGTTDSFNCPTGTATTAPIATGNYNVRVLLRANGTTIASTDLAGAFEIADGENTALGNVVLNVENP